MHESKEKSTTAMSLALCQNTDDNNNNNQGQMNEQPGVDPNGAGGDMTIYR